MDSLSRDTKKKKVLIITYYWPPAGGPGVQRVLKFVKYLPESGWEPVVLTVKNGEYPATDESLLKDIPPGIKVFKTRSLEPFHLYRLLRGQTKDAKIDPQILKNKKPGIVSKIFQWIRFNIFLPDARIGWYPFAVWKGKEILKKEHIDVILTSSPPHSLQLIGKRLAHVSGTPWVADFRDPWSSIHFYQNVDRMFLSRKIESYLEQKVLKSADQVTTVSHHISHQLQKIGDRKSCPVIYNGYDSTDFTFTGRHTASKKTIITYAGLLSDTQLPYTLIDLLAENRNADLASVELHIYGRSSVSFNELIKEKKVEKKVIHHGYVDHSLLTQRMSQSDALLIIVNRAPDNKGILSGKLFDYMGARRPIIGLGPTDGEVETIINDTSSGWYIEYDDKEGMQSCLHELTTGQFSFQFNTSAFERKNQTHSLSKVLLKACGGTRRTT